MLGRMCVEDLELSFVNVAGSMLLQITLLRHGE